MNRLSAVFAALLCGLSMSAAHAGTFFALTPDPSRPAGGPTPEGCVGEPGLALGLLTPSAEQSNCHAGQLGTIFDGAVFSGNQDAATSAVFVTPVLHVPLSVGGTARLVVYTSVQSNCCATGGQGVEADLTWSLREKHDHGAHTFIASGTAFRMAPSLYSRGEAYLEIPAHTLEVGSRLQLLLGTTGSPESRVVFGGVTGDGRTFADAGITFDVNHAADPGTGDPVDPPVDPPTDPEDPPTDPEDPPADPEDPPTDPGLDPQPSEEPEPDAQERGRSGGGAFAPWMLAMLLALRARRLAAMGALMLLASVNPAFGARDATQLGIVTFAQQGAPTATQLAALRATGLQVQGLRRLPMAFVRGTSLQLARATPPGSGRRFDPDRRLTLFSEASNARIGASALHGLGLTGHGMTVAVVDSGIDATHPDLADHVTHNVRILSPEYAGLDNDAVPLLVTHDFGPGSNTDLNYGHGTAVAGIIAADGTTAPAHVGVAPDATLIGYSTGDVTWVLSVIAAFDHILDHPDWGIDVVNNSWGDLWSLYDPEEPVNVATRALADAGIAVVFAVGNNGAGSAEMTQSKVTLAPWVIGVAATTPNDARADFSSNGLMVDNSLPVAAVDGHVRFTGDRLGINHPSVAAPGAGIETSCTPTMVTLYVLLLQPCVPGGTVTGDGTSFAAPHISGLLALLRQARPTTTVAELKQVLEATAGATADRAPFWQVGFGLVDGAAALELVRSKNLPNSLRKAHAAAQARALAGRQWRARVSEYWTWPSAPIDAAGAVDSRVLPFEVPAGTPALIVGTSVASIDPELGFRVVVRDAAGAEVGSTAPVGSGVSHAVIDLTAGNHAFGSWTLHVASDAYAYYDPWGDYRITVVATLAEPQLAASQGGFVADGTLPLLFVPDPARATGLTSDEGCVIEPGQAIGSLGPVVPEGPCHTASQGWLAANPELYAEFTSAPFATSLLLGGPTLLTVHMVDPLRPTADGPLPPQFQHVLEILGPNSEVTVLSAGEDTLDGYGNGRNEERLELAPVEVPAGARLRLRLLTTGVTSSAARMLFGDARYDSGLTLTYGHIEGADGKTGAPKNTAAAPASTGVVVGALSPGLLLAWIAMLASRQRTSVM